MENPIDKSKDTERPLCGTMLLFAGKIKEWGGHESEEAMHAANGTIMPEKGEQLPLLPGEEGPVFI